MNILAFEYITGGGMVGQELPASLVREGEMMLTAVVNDFEELDDMNVLTLRDYRLNAEGVDSDFIIGVGDSYFEVIENLTEQLDMLLIIAPETDGVLAALCNWFSKFPITLLNSTVQSIELASNKLDTFNYLQKFDIPQIPTFLPNEIGNFRANKYVKKPIDGVGCDNLFLLDNVIELHKHNKVHTAEKYIVQPFIDGVHASLSLLCWGGECNVLSCNKQNLIEENGTLRLQGCEVNAFNRAKFRTFSNKLIKALPDLRGYIGVDILINENEIMLVEINPRLTTSYVGIKDALGLNPAELMLHCFMHNQLPKLKAVENRTIIIDIETSCAA